VEEETKDEVLVTQAQGDAADLRSEPTQTEVPLAAALPEHNNGLNQKRARIMIAGILTAVLLSVVAVTVAGIFGLTTRWMKVCPTDLPVNDPARQLAQQLVAEKVGSHSLGVSGNLAEETRLKGMGSSHEKEQTDPGKRQ
jgi:hypothetical protein